MGTNAIGPHAHRRVGGATESAVGRGARAAPAGSGPPAQPGDAEQSEQHQTRAAWLRHPHQPQLAADRAGLEGVGVCVVIERPWVGDDLRQVGPAGAPGEPKDWTSA